MCKCRGRHIRTYLSRVLRQIPSCCLTLQPGQCPALCVHPPAPGWGLCPGCAPATPPGQFWGVVTNWAACPCANPCRCPTRAWSVANHRLPMPGRRAHSQEPPTAYPGPCSTHTALSCNRGLSPGVPAVCGFCDLSNPCRCRARMVAKFGCLSATHPPARCVRGCRSGGAYAWAACRGFVCISPAAPGWGIPMGVFQ